MAPAGTSDQSTRRASVGVYTRISRVGGRSGEGFISQDVQEETAEAVANTLNLDIAGYWHDPDQTGGNLQRPEWERLMARVIDPHDPLQGVIVARVDRFARNVPEGAPEIRRIWDSNGGRGIFVAADLPIDTTAPVGRRVLWDWLSSAELQLELLKAGWWKAKRSAVQRGAHIGRVPFGYRKVPKGQPGAGALEPDPATAPLVTELFAREATRRFTIASHCRWLQQVAPKPNGWKDTTVQRMLERRTYLGEVHQGDSIEPNRDAHEPLVDPMTFARCQPRPSARRRASRTFLLSGLVRCAGCSYAMGGFSYGGARGDTPVYVCRAKGCTSRSTIVAEKLDGYVLALIRPALDREIVSAREADSDLVLAEAEVARLRDERQSFASDLDARRLLGDDWLPALQARTDALNAKIAERDQVAARTQLAATGKRSAADFDRHELRDFLERAVRAVFVRRVPTDRRAPVERRAMVVWSDDPRQFPVPTAGRASAPLPVAWDE